MSFKKILGIAFSVACLAPSLNAKSLIQLGWDQPTTELVRDHWQELEKMPFDGITVEVAFTHEGVSYNDYSIMTKKRWPRDVLRPALENLRSARFTRLKNNFIRVNSTPGDLDWFNDEEWDAAAANVANIAWLARESGMKGIVFDTETYNNKQYMWRPDSGHTFEETYAKARQRGAQVMKAITDEYPDITVLALWLFSKTPFASNTGSVKDALSYNEYGLWPAVVNGWLDALPPGARLVDGMEDAYYFQDMAEFPKTYASLRSVNSPMISGLLAPENRKKYESQVSISFGIYLDAFLNTPSAVYYLGPLSGGTQLGRLRDTLVKALDYADDYVWVYNEQVRWWPIETPTWQAGGRFYTTSQKYPGKGKIAEDAFPGITDIVNFARSSGDVKVPFLKGVPNLLENGGFSDFRRENDILVPAIWWNWQRNGSHGTFSVAENSKGPSGRGLVRLKGITSGCLAQTLPVKSGVHYLIEGYVRKYGSGVANISVRWKADTGKWNNLTSEVIIGSNSDHGEWQRLSEVVTVPEGSSHMCILLYAGNQGADDLAEFSDLSVRKLPHP